ncbi:Diguanylate cyclase (GGDEF domain) with PAS/PAC sensor [Paramagnetospirillum magnetotacticum MS-1]|uniref:histidine kinase n=1 Tax=Paramagnetospirillum magnetotacticum MS-1 TaxID=272627 RepID=A0A0C2YXX6_PARME|nr:hybrid sensor histidine kinase/response regulator [Paramagnetospirillum magnetotacticum]KIL99958.1 Diguanylate cyclase (GGDEF domain) with PAS/PAC sensor [Paramagnetospirillum magnetotacticum MS-1]
MAEPRKLSLKPRGDASAHAPAAPPWPVLIVDDDEQVHQMTRVVLRDLSYMGRPFKCIEATSAAEAAAILDLQPEIPVVLLDVVMETPDAGLRLVRHIREELGNRRIRIILRTGQPGDAPERDVVLGYDINDYKSKSELTAQKMFTALVGALRAWNDITTIERLNAELAGLNNALERKVEERTAELRESNLALDRSKTRAETALLRETEAKGQLRQFLSMVSHEFRTPLAIIDSSAQMLRIRVEKSDPGGVARLDTIRGGVQRLLGLIDTCLADEQLESGRIVLHEKSFDIGPMIEVALSHYRVASPTHRYCAQFTPGLAVWGDPGMIALVINNLVGNAVKYSPAGSDIFVAAAADGGDVAISVTDQGMGIPEEDQDNIFERFHRAANSKGIPGSGIGLHMVRQIVEMHGGTVTVQSQLQRGSCFTVRLRPSPGPGAEGIDPVQDGLSAPVPDDTVLDLGEGNR